MFFDPFVGSTEFLIACLFNGPGTLPIITAAEHYGAVAAGFHGAAASVGGSTALLEEAWNGASSEGAKGSFRLYRSWLIEHGNVAMGTSAAFHLAAEEHSVARAKMTAVQTWLAEFEVRQTALALGGPGTVPVMLASEAESVAIFTAATNVMSGYAVGIGNAIARFPTPTTAQPIVNNGGGLGTPPGNPVPGPWGKTVVPITTPHPPPGNPIPPPGNPPPGNPTPPPGNPTPPPGNPVPPSPTDPLPGGPDPVSGTPSTDQGTNGYDTNSDSLNSTADQSIDTTSGSTGLGAGYAAFSMTRGGLGAMSGSATGFRLPAKWGSRGSRAFGAEDEAETRPALRRGAAPKGASAPEGQLRRRKDREKTRSATVIAPGEDIEVPDLETGDPGLGVLGYVEELADEPMAETSGSIGVIERVDKESTLQSVTGDSRD
jgi:hypothetical protein